MRRTALYSSARKQGSAADAEPVATRSPAPSAPTAVSSADNPATRSIRLRPVLFAAAMLLAGAAGVVLDRHFAEPARFVTQDDIDRAVRASLENKPLPSKAAKAFEAIHPSVVRVDGFDHPEGVGSLPENTDPDENKNDKDNAARKRQSVGTGVVITERGSILTNLHVVVGTSRIRVVFADGTESEAVVTGADPDNDLAVLQAKKLPDDLQPATLITTGDLRPGDEVLAVGFPFGFGPSASTGVVSGLKREFVSSDGKRALTNLIQFDAAANPGNSGGPLVNMEGEVLGIVTAILNPTHQGFFVGLAFAVPIENAASAVGVPPF